MSYEEEKEKAKRFLTDRKWDVYLVEAYLNLRQYPFLRGRFDFEDALNIGVTNVSGVKTRVEVGSVKGEVTATQCEFNGVRFLIAGESSFSALPNDELLCTLGVCLFLGEQRAMAVEYRFPGAGASRASDHTLLEVEELHASARLEALLRGLHDASVAHQVRMEEKRRRSEEAKFNGDPDR